MTWVKPKTDWKPQDYFNLDPDYVRIKGNIQTVHEMAKSFYSPSELVEMKDYVIGDDVLPDFFNNIVDNIDGIKKSTFTPVGYESMKKYTGNGRIWTEKELNTIENNTLLLYNMYKGQENLLPKLAFELGGTEF